MKGQTRSVWRFGGAALAAALAVISAGVPLCLAAETASTGRVHFQDDVHPAPPDYASSMAWAVLPGQPNLSLEQPGGGTARESASGVDVFYIQPTTFETKTHWNQDILDAKTNAWTDVSVIGRQASIFNTCCRIFAPRYRQAGTGSLGSSDGDQAYDLAYGDVRRAFDFYVAHYNHGRPFILAGHSQGALHIYRLVAEEIDGKPVARRLVAAYAIGVPATVGAFGSLFTSVGPCLKPLQTHCIVSWNSFIAGADTRDYITRAPQPYVKRHTVAGDTSLFCINPLTFDADRPSAPASLNEGALPGPPAEGPLPPLVKGAVGASCQKGILLVEPSPGETIKLNPLPGGALHLQDLDLFYRQIQLDAEARARAFLNADRTSR